MAEPVLVILAQKKIGELLLEVRNLSIKLQGEESFNQAAWGQYGSELCGGEMLANENKIREEIAEVEGKALLLQRFIGGGLDLSQEYLLKTQCEYLDTEIAQAQERKRTVAAQLEEIAKVKRLLAIIF